MDIIYGENSGTNERPYIEELTTSTRTQARQKRSGKKREKKQSDAFPLMGMLNDATKEYEKLVSIREILKSTRLDISLLDLVAWSSASCKEIKRLCIQVTKQKKSQTYQSYKYVPAPIPTN